MFMSEFGIRVILVFYNELGSFSLLSEGVCVKLVVHFLMFHWYSTSYLNFDGIYQWNHLALEKFSLWKSFDCKFYFFIIIF